MAAIFYSNNSGWWGGGGERKKFVPRGWATVKSKERDGGAETYFRPSFSLQYTYHGWMIGEAFLTNEMFRMLKVIRVTEFTF